LTCLVASTVGAGRVGPNQRLGALRQAGGNLARAEQLRGSDRDSRDEHDGGGDANSQTSGARETPGPAHALPVALRPRDQVCPDGAIECLAQLGEAIWNMRISCHLRSQSLLGRVVEPSPQRAQRAMHAHTCRLRRGVERDGHLVIGKIGVEAQTHDLTLGRR